MNVEAAIRQAFADDGHMWDGVVDVMRKSGAPAKIELMGGDLYSIQVDTEDPENYVIMGVERNPNVDWQDFNGCWVNAMPRAEADYVVGYHYQDQGDEANFEFSDLEVYPIDGDPLDDYVMAEAMLVLWRTLRDAPTPNRG